MAASTIASRARGETGSPRIALNRYGDVLPYMAGATYLFKS